MANSEWASFSRWRRGALFGVAIFLPSACQPQSVGSLGVKVDAYLAPDIENGDFAGAILIGTADSVLLRRAYGMADLEARRDHTNQTKFAIASLTKTFTAAAIVILRDRGVLSFDDPVSKFLPEFPHGDAVTILNLLRHESGLSNPDYEEAFRGPISHERLVEIIGNKPLLFEPGTDGRYSNAGFNVLALVVARAAGTTFDEFLRSEIFEPLGMRSIGNFATREIVEDRARPYLPGPPPHDVVNATPPELSYSTGSGSVWATIDDLHRWAVAVHSKELFDRSTLGYPYGWGRLGEGGEAGLDQTGASTGYTSQLLIQFDPAVFVVVLTNVGFGDWTRWGRDLMAMVGGGTPAPAERRVLTDLDPSALPRYIGTFAFEEETIRIVAEGGHLWARSANEPTGSFLSPSSSTRFERRAECTLDFGSLRGERYETIDYRCGEFFQATYRRTSRP